MLKLMDLSDVTKNLIPVTSTEFFVGKTNSFHPDGLFSEKIFGPLDSPDRRKTYSYIDLNTKVLHPALFSVIRRLEQKLLLAMSGEKTYGIDSDGYLVPDENGILNGMTSVVENFNKIKFRGGTGKRKDLINLLENYKKKNLIFIDKVLVIPPNYRDLTIHDSGEITIQPLNEYYLNIIRLSLQIMSMRSGTVYDLLSYRMFNLVKDLYDYIMSKMAKKTGLLRGHMLGKRVDFSARAVIVGAASELRPNEIGVPFKLLVKLFEPFVLYELLNSGKTAKEELAKELEQFNGSKLSALTLRKLFIGIYKHDEIPERLEELIKDAIERAIDGKVVIAKRDPALHAESVQAFYPKIVPGNTIKLCPVKCPSFNADFDGDQMALYVPITKQAIEEAKDKLMVTISKNGQNQVSDGYEKDVAIGAYMLTRDPGKSKKTRKKILSVEDAFSLNIYDPVQFGGFDTTAGRVIFNSILPDKMKFINKAVDKKYINKLADHIFNTYGKEVYLDFSDKLLKVSFKYGTIASPSFSLNDFEIPKDVKQIKEKIKGMTPDKATDLLNHAEKRLSEDLTNKQTNLGMLGEAGGLKGWGQTRQILVSKGLIQDTTGKVLPPIPESYTEGFKSREFFMTGSGTRKGISDRVLNTADTGYLSRQLVYALQRVEADPNIYNCGTKRSFQVKVTKDIVNRLKGRYLLIKGKPVEITDPTKLIGKVIPLKSPLYCITPKLCKTCYGKLLDRNRTLYVGVLAAQIFGERGTQLIMKCSDGLVHYNNQLWAFEDLWNFIDEPVEMIDGKMTKVLHNQSVDCKDEKVDTIKIQKHNPTDKLLFISTKSGHNLIVQSNHPLWIKKNPLHSKYHNDDCMLIGDNLYKECVDTNKLFEIDDDEMVEMTASDVKKNDSIWIDSTLSINNTNNIVPKYNGYSCGMYCAKDVNSEMFNKDKNISNIVLGNYAWEKRLAPDFIDYDKNWLKGFISGLLDGNGSVITNESTVCRIYTSSHYLMQQLKSICCKLGYKLNTQLMSTNKSEENSIEINRPSYVCDISFLENPNLESIKLSDVDIKYVNQKEEIAIRGFDVISDIKEIDLWQYPVYDIQTENKQYMLSNVLNHNTFHSGGAVSVNKIDVKKILSNYMTADELKHFTTYFTQKDNDVFTSTKCNLIINRKEYLDQKKDIKINKTDIKLSYGYFILDTGSFKLPITIDAEVIINITNKNIADDGTLIVMQFDKGEKLFNVPPVTDTFSDQMKQVEHLLSGKKPWRSADHFCMKLYDQYGPNTKDADMVHFEVLASNLLRDSNNPSYPARLNPNYSASITNIKQIPAMESWLSALSFENPNEAITMGLAYDREQTESILEKIVKGTL